MPVTVEVDEAGILQLRGLLGEISEDIKDFDAAGVWQEVSEIFSDEVEKVFEKEGAHGGPKWSRLAPATVKQRTRLGYTPIRVGWASGRMAQSLTSPSHPEAIEIRRPDEFMRGTAASSGGVSYPSIFERRRPILGHIFSDAHDAIERITEAVKKRVFKALGRDK